MPAAAQDTQNKGPARKGLHMMKAVGAGLGAIGVWVALCPQISVTSPDPVPRKNTFVCRFMIENTGYWSAADVKVLYYFHEMVSTHENWKNRAVEFSATRNEKLQTVRRNQPVDVFMPWIIDLRGPVTQGRIDISVSYGYAWLEWVPWFRRIIVFPFHTVWKDDQMHWSPGPISSPANTIIHDGRPSEM